MATEDRCVALYPYFKVAPGKLDEFRKICERFVARSENEPKCLYYGFSFNGDHVHCREGYEDAEGLLAHLENVGPILTEALAITEVSRLELHACEEEIAKLRGPLKELNVTYFTLEYGFRR